jgi:hypothetical protein
MFINILQIYITWIGRWPDNEVLEILLSKCNLSTEILRVMTDVDLPHHLSWMQHNVLNFIPVHWLEQHVTDIAVVGSAIWMGRPHNKLSKHIWLAAQSPLWKHMQWWIMCESLLPVLPVSEMLLTDAQISCLMHKLNSFTWQQKLSPKNCGIRISSCNHDQNCSLNNEDAPYACESPFYFEANWWLKWVLFTKKEKRKKRKKKLLLFT